jgi:hypothetical protein
VLQLSGVAEVELCATSITLGIWLLLINTMHFMIDYQTVMVVARYLALFAC